LHLMQITSTVLAKNRLPFPLLLILSVLSAPTLAENIDESAQGSVQGHEIHHFHKHDLGVFAGITHGGRRKNEPAFGVEY
jgi:hypothetical protein